MPLDSGSGGEGGGGRAPSLNVLGTRLENCSIKPMTGFYRNGCCDTGPDDIGSHTVCVVATAEFLKFSKSAGNDLSTPMPGFGFAGLKPGDTILALDLAQGGHHQSPRQFGRGHVCALADLKRYAIDLA